MIGGSCFFEEGYFVVLIVFVNVEDEMIIVKEEIFGLVLIVILYEIVDEVIEWVNYLEYGFVVGLWIENVKYVYYIVDCF